jgi:hypothetical protein
MGDIIAEMMEWGAKYIGDGAFFGMALVSCVFLYVTSQKDRKRIVYPIIASIVLAMNPFSISLLFSGMSYWRFLWMIPDGILIGIFFVKMIKVCRVKREVIAAFVSFMLIIMISGTYVYGEGKFMKAQTPDKLSRGVKAVCETMLELDDHPRALMREKYLCEVRQYSGDIELYYGRNIHWYITFFDWEHQNYYKMMESRNPNYDKLLALCLEEDLNFIVTYANRAIPENILEEYGFREVTEKDNSIIYYRPDVAS